MESESQSPMPEHEADITVPRMLLKSLLQDFICDGREHNRSDTDILSVLQSLLDECGARHMEKELIEMTDLLTGA